MRMFYKENYFNPDRTKDLEVSILKIFYVEPEFLEPPIDLARRKKGEKFDGYTDDYLLTLLPENYGGGQFWYHPDFLVSSYKYTEEYDHEINEDHRKIALENNGILLQTVWDVVIFDCGIEIGAIGASAEKLANSDSWQLTRGGDLFTKILSAKFSSSFFTKCAILSDVFENHPSDAPLAQFIEYNDIGLPLAHRVNIAEKMSDLDEDDIDNFDYIDETWDQLCETLGVDKEGDFTSYKDMIQNR